MTATAPGPGFPEEFTQAARHAAVAATRFGYGPRPGELDWIADDPALWLVEQLDDAPAPKEIAGLPDSGAVLAAAQRARASGSAALRRHRLETAAAVRREAAQHVLPAVNSDRPFRERLVRFWSEFFAVSTRDPETAALAHAFEREVIRPNLTGRFYDMLLAAVRHPAMILAHDNASSFTERSPAGRDRRGNLIDGLARAILERYTLGPVGTPGGAFTERDVRALARMLTGWTIDPGGGRESRATPLEGTPKPPRAFRFEPALHDEGTKHFLGRNYPPSGVLEAEAALDVLSRMPTTGYRLARIMARHFVADDPPDAVVNALVDGYADRGGHLGGMALALARAAATFDPGLRKLKRPDDLVISAYRAFDLRPSDGGEILRAMAMMGMENKGYTLPNGHPATDDYWQAPDRFADRLDWTAGAATRLATQADALGDGTPAAAIRHGFAILGARLTERTHRWLSVAPDAREGLALLLLSPEFQTR